MAPWMFYKRKEGMHMQYDVVLLEKPIDEGLTRDEVMKMIGMADDEQFFPLEISNPNGTSAAMGIMGAKTADRLANVAHSGFVHFVESILDDMEKESETGEYVYSVGNYKGETVTASVWLGRNLPERSI